MQHPPLTRTQTWLAIGLGGLVLVGIGLLVPSVRAEFIGFAVRSQLVASEQSMALSSAVAVPVPVSSETALQADAQYADLRARIATLEASAVATQKQLTAAIAELTASNDAYQTSLAKWQADQQKLLASSDVPAQAAASPAVQVGTASAKINLNTATVDQLDSLPGVGPSLAQKIIAYRASHHFSQVDDLVEVSGIGEALLAKLRDLVTV
jgi:competence protein ComEA